MATSAESGSSQPVEVATTERPTWVRWQVVAILIGYSFMTWFNRVSMEAAGAKIIDAKTLSETQVGSVYSSFFLMYTIFMTPGGWVSDRFGPRVALMLMGLGSAFCGACTGLVGLAATAPTMLLLSLWLVRGSMGLCTAPIYPATGRLVSRWLPMSSRAWGNGLVLGAASVGIGCTYILFSWLIDRMGWPAAFLVSGCVTAGLAILFAMYVTDWPMQHRRVNVAERRLIEPSSNNAAHFPHDERPGPPSAMFREAARPSLLRSVVGELREWLFMLRNRSLLLITIGYAAVGYFEYLFFFWVRHYFDKVLQLGKDESQFYAMFPPLAMAIGMPLGGWLSDRLARSHGYRVGRAAVPAAGMLLSAVLLMIGIVAANRHASPTTIVIWFSLALGAIGVVEGPTWTTAIQLGGRRGSTAAGICNTGGNAGGTLAPTITPWVGTTLGWNYSLALSCIICLVGVVLWFWIDPEDVIEGEPQHRSASA